MRVPSKTGQNRLVVNNDAREVTLDGRVIELTRIEFDMLSKLFTHPRTVITNEQLSRSVLGSDWYTGPHSIAVHIGHIRQKLGQDGDQAGCIVNKRGIGYMYDPNALVEPPVPTSGCTCVLEYNQDLVLTHAEPLQPDLLGWDLRDLVGARFVLPVRGSGSSKDASDVRQFVIAAEIRKLKLAATVICADGGLARADLELKADFTANGHFRGLREYVHVLA